jgi:carbonic anhydrase
MISAKDALTRLREGNLRFVSGSQNLPSRSDEARRSQLSGGQEPFAIILGCSDSRVPAEIVFDEGLGDLFVIRVAGNIVAPSQIGSVEYAAETTGARLVVVLGHSRCGAVLATLDQLERPKQKRSHVLHAIVERIRPAVEPIMSLESDLSPEELVQRAVRANIHASMAQLQAGSEIIEQMIREDGLFIVGAEYSLDTGRVEFFS